ncbi:MAG: rRNA maturation RNase YbeY [bacterium]|nr:rRNA maturation RNase YbeY [bacterium]
MVRLHCSPVLVDIPDADCLERLNQVARRTLGSHDAGGIVDVILTDDVEVRRLNCSYRGRDQATDVLSFSFVEHGQETVVPPEFFLTQDTPAGEVYISVERASVQAEELGVPADEELARLLIHGLLHLAGYDHQTESELCIMEELTEQLLSPISDELTI